MHSCNVMSGSYLFPSFFFSAEGRQRQHKLYTLCCGSFAPMHNWPQCPEGDIRPEAILSRTFGSSGTKLDSDGERSSGCECYSWMLIPAHTLHSGRTMGKYCLLLMEMEMETTEQTLQFFYFCIFDE